VWSALKFGIEPHLISAGRFHVSAVRMILEDLDEGRMLDDIFYTGEKSGYTLGVERVSDLEFIIAFGCVAGPDAGVVAKWEVEYD